ncbi:MAG: ParB-like nuclease domain-containing protein [Clostridia bacterium]|nr:ParB-like nuclease domain-containing protein [Clostridia bacterium]
MEKTQFETFLAEEVIKVKGVYYPIKAGFLRRAFIKTAPCEKLHPNPNDEFCFPDIGPNYDIISRYVGDYIQAGKDLGQLRFLDSSASEPLDVERTSPDGYMILNGHHRWGAALKLGMKTIPIRIVDLTQKSDIQKMLNATGFHRRVTLDLDEVVFRPENDPNLEKQLPFPMRRIYKERLRRGIPALFNMLNRHGYDIWIYTANYYSLEYLRHYFKHYRIHVTGIVTGTARKGPEGTDTRNELEKLCNSKYKTTVHIDNKAVIRTFRGVQNFEEFPLSGASETWSRDVMDAFEKMNEEQKKNEKKRRAGEDAGIL